MKTDTFDALTRMISTGASRRDALRALMASGLAASGLTAASSATKAQVATPGATPAGDTAQAAFDALDADTRDAIARALWNPDLKVADIPADILANVLDPRNSSQAFGARVGAHLLQLIAQPTSFVQSYAPRYETMLPYCSSLSAHQAYVMSNLIGPEATIGYRPIPTEADFVFPERNAMDLQAILGWYFFVGSALGSDGEEYGIELMFFRDALLPPALAAALGLTDVENQVVELHLAVTRAGERHYQAKPIVIAGTTGLLAFETDGFGATMGKNVMRSLEPGNLFPLQIQGWGQDDGEVEPVQFSIDLTFSSGKGYLLQGADGCSPCCDGAGTLYYSVPNLVLDPSVSSLNINGEQVTLTEGTFWFDHQWGTLGAVTHTDVVRAVSNLSPTVQTGWDWFMAQFHGNRQITSYSIHSLDNQGFYRQMGTTSPGAMTVSLNARYMDEEAVTHTVAGVLSVTEWILSVDTPSPETFPPTYTWYPNRWEFQFGDDVPEDIRTFTMVPIVQTGQSGFFAAGAQYSEGAVYLLDPAGADLGRGFAESVGYANTTPNLLRLVGIPASDNMLALFGSNVPDDGMVLASQAFTFLHAGELKDALDMCIGL